MIIAVCDANYNFLNAMRAEIAKINPAIAVYCYTDKEKLLKGASEKYDAVFMNTELAAESGISAALELKKVLPDTEVIFVTHNSEKYAQMIFYNINLLRPFAYLVKPISRAYMKKIINCLEQELIKRNIGNMIIKSNCGSNVIVPMTDVVYVAHNNRMSYLYSKNKTIECRYPISFFDAQLPCRQFVHASKSCIVNLAEVISVVSGEITMSNGDKLYTSRNYKAPFEQQFEKYYSMCNVIDAELVLS